MASLPLNIPLSLLQSKWSGILNPFLKNPLNSVQILKSVSLANGTTVINHGLGRTLQGWFIIDISGAATVYRSAAKNAATLSLTSNAAVTADIAVF